MPVLGVSLYLVTTWYSCLLSACKTEPAIGEGAPVRVLGAPGEKCLCAVLLCLTTWEAIPNNEEVTCNKVTSSKITCLVLQVDVKCCSQLLPPK